MPYFYYSCKFKPEILQTYIVFKQCRYDTRMQNKYEIDYSRKHILHLPLKQTQFKKL